MKREIIADYSQTFLLPPSLEDWIGSDHPARFIRDFVAILDFKALGFHTPACETGRPPYSNQLLLCVWLYGYLQKIRSSRGLERACRDNISLLWLTGVNSPDHNTLWRFYSTNKQALRSVFRQLVGVACSSGLVGLVVHAVDGTKIRSRSSDVTAWHQKELEALLKSVDSSIDEIMSEIESSEVSESGEYRLPDDLVDAKKRREKINEALAQLAKIDRSHMHPDDPEARMIRSGGGGTHLNYNAQAVVDRDSGLIVSEKVVNAESDNEMLVEMVDDVVRNTGHAADETVGDGGYYSPGELVKAEERGHGVLVSIPKDSSKRGRFSRSNFRYDESEDVYICPEDKCLVYWRTCLNSHGKYQVRVYRCRNAKHCPVSSQCSSNKQGRTIYRSEHETVVARQREKQKAVRKQELIKSRKWIVEPIFGQIKENMGFRRWTVCGLENVRTQWSLICTVFNLKKLYRYWLEGRLVFSR